MRPRRSTIGEEDVSHRYAARRLRLHDIVDPCATMEVLAVCELRGHRRVPPPLVDHRHLLSQPWGENIALLFFTVALCRREKRLRGLYCFSSHGDVISPFRATGISHG